MVKSTLIEFQSPVGLFMVPSAEHMKTMRALAQGLVEGHEPLDYQAHATPRAGQGVMNSQNGTNGTPPSCSRAARVKYGMAYGARALGSRSFRSSQRTGKPSTRAQRSQSSPTAKGSMFPDGTDG